MDPYFGDDPFSDSYKEKTIKVYRNGDFTEFIEMRLKSNIRVNELTKELEDKLKMKPIKKLRLFNSEGVEIFAEELEYLNTGDIIFASRGEEFDRNSGLSEYEVIEKLGEGGFGNVSLAQHKLTKEKCAIKFLKGSSLGNAHDMVMIFAEAETLRNLHHKNIVHIKKCFTLNDMKVALVMEYLEGGELKDYILSKGKLAEEEARDFFNQIVDAVNYCHRERVIHRDLKLENILLEGKDSKVVKIVDFGIAGLSSNVSTEIDAGSLDYMPPELLTGKLKGSNPCVDVWALGVILYGMVFGTLPFTAGDNKKTFDKIVNGQYTIPTGASCSRELKDLFHRILTVEYKDRISVTDIMIHPWMTGEKFPDEESDEEEKENTKKTEKALPVKKVSLLGAKKDNSSPNLKKGALPAQRGSMFLSPSTIFGSSGSSGTSGTRASLKPGSVSTTSALAAGKKKSESDVKKK